MTEQRKFLILKGGSSSEREISLKTAAHVEAAFDRMGLDYQSREVNGFSECLSLPLKGVDYVFNALHGGYGEDGTLQAFLDGLDIRYNGAGREASAICMSKVLTRLVASASGVRVPEGVWIPCAETANFSRLQSTLGTSFVVKPDAQGCSIGVSAVNSKDDFDAALSILNKFKGRTLFEELVSGDEITVGVLDGEILPFLLISHTHSLFSYDAKFNSPDTTCYSIAQVPPDVVARVEKDVWRMCCILGIRDYARFDFIIKDGVPFLLEVNTLPGLNSHSVFVKASGLAGMDYDSVIGKIINS
ncbi:D-alanine--D-alanine ligase [Pseudomonas brassicacearum]|uniref:D-alanine--D-alanine ligase family protein n=1 Tax=Pseudomonas brassicacearum TaxID=930166 RepID=UPI0016106D94|nr:D-alanine--D-alanine ligase [Pseudomonas brassicacearum]